MVPVTTASMSAGLITLHVISIVIGVVLVLSVLISALETKTARPTCGPSTPRWPWSACLWCGC
jgi:hypothetical protein